MKIIKSRKTNCINDVNRYVNSFVKSSQSSQNKRKRTLYLLTEDLLNLGLLPNQLKDLKNDYIQELIKYWQTKKLSTMTIVNRIGILRKMMLSMYDIVMPDNKTLGIQSTAKKPIYRSVDRGVLDLVHHPITKTILAFQMCFGLTKIESINIILDTAIQSDDLYISAQISSNNKDRFVPIVTQVQRQVIEYRYDVLGSYRSLPDRIPDYLITSLVNAEIHDCGYDVQAPFRRIYAQERLATLCKTKPKRLATKMLVEELGYLNYQKLREGLLS